MRTALADSMPVRRYRDLRTWRLTEEFKSFVFKLLAKSDAANRNLKYRDQLIGSSAGPSKHVAEGFLRFNPVEFCRFLDYAVSAIGETENDLKDGISQGYFKAADCTQGFALAVRCTKSILSLKASQRRYIEEHGRGQPPIRKRRAPPTAS